MLEWSLRAAAADDAHWIAELRAVVLRADLERLDASIRSVSGSASCLHSIRP